MRNLDSVLPANMHLVHVPSKIIFATKRPAAGWYRADKGFPLQMNVIVVSV